MLINRSIQENFVGSKNSVFWDIFTAVTKKDVVFWDVTPCGCSKNQRFGGTYRIHLEGNKILIHPSSQLLLEPHGVISQKIPFFDLTFLRLFRLASYRYCGRYAYQVLRLMLRWLPLSTGDRGLHTSKLALRDQATLIQAVMLVLFFAYAHFKPRMSHWLSWFSLFVVFLSSCDPAIRRSAM
jgi:hypothetical protein